MKLNKLSLSMLGLLTLSSFSSYAITNGEIATTSETPWMAYLSMSYSGGSDSDPSECAGIIISDSLVLTSAQCVESSNLTTLSANYFAEGHRVASSVLIDVKNIKIHSDWNGSIEGGNDIAMLYDPNGSFSDVKPMKVISDGEFTDMDLDFDINYVNNQDTTPNVLATGFHESSDDMLLGKVMMTGLPSDTCNSIKDDGSFSTDDVVCVKSYDIDVNRSICQGDRGGPLIWQNPNNSSDDDFGLRVVGVSSYIHSDQDKYCASSNGGYVAFTSINSHTQWINFTAEDFLGIAFDVNNTGIDYSLAENPIYSPDDIDDDSSTDEDGDLGGDTDIDTDEPSNEVIPIDEALSGSTNGGSFGLGSIFLMTAFGFLRKRRK